MALSADNIIQFDEGSVAATAACAVTLPAGTTDGSHVVVFMQSLATSITAATGFTGSFSATGIAYYWKVVGAAETSWTFTQNTAQDATWAVLEMSGLDPIDPAESSPSSGPATLSTGQTQASSTTSPVGLSSVTFAVFSAYVSTQVKSWGSYTNSFTEITSYDAPTGTNRPCIAVTARYTDGAPTPLTCTGTLTIASGTASARARVIVLREAGSPVSAPVQGLTGFEYGTHGGLAEATVHATGSNQPLGASANFPVGTWGTHYSIGAFGRNGDYGMRIAVSAATCSVPTAYGPTVGTYGQNLRVVSGTGTPTIMTWNVTTGTDLLLVYDVATEKFGLRWGAGSVEYQTGTTPLGTWAWVEVRIKVNATTHRADWWCETGDPDGLQTSPAYLTGQVSTTVAPALLGSLASQTVTFDADDPVVAQYYAAFPLSLHRVIRLVPEGTGATVSGTSANFQRFTANGTLAAVNGTEGALLDECPPTLSASADGVAQVNNAAGDYLQLPMQTYTLASNEVIAGVRMIAAMWGGTGTGTGTFAIKGWDGTTETAFTGVHVYDAGSPTAISATEPLWMAASWSNTAGTPWTQARLDAAAIRVGYSADATPDMGVSAVYLEVAIKTIAASQVKYRLTSDEDPEAVAATVTELLHPYTSGVRAYTVTNGDANRTAVFNYSIGGTPQTPVTVAPLDPPVDVVVGAEVFGEVDSTSFGWQ